MQISKIDWGDDSAEKDPNLLQYFVSNSALDRLKNRNKTFIVGRKGAGKSALRKKLTSYFESEGYIVVEASPSYNIIRNIVTDKELSLNFGDEVFFQYVWLRYLLNSALIKIGDCTSGNLASGSLEFARKLALQSGQTNKDLLESLSEVLNRIKIKAGKLGDLGISVENTLRVEAEIDSYEHHIKELSAAGYKIIFMVDDLDLGWNNSPVANNLLLGLLTTTNYIKALSGHLHIFVYIRDDVYRILLTKTQHSDKYRDIESLRWTDDDLINLLSERIRFNYRKEGVYIEAEPFETVFPSMVGTSNTTNWLIERTLRRPRELLQISRVYSEKNESELPNADLLREAELQYSNWKLDDLCTEFSYQYPRLREVFAFWKTKFFRNKYHLKRDEIDEVLFKILLEVNCMEEWFLALKREVDILGFLNILYQIGFIGDFILGGQGGSKVIYSVNDVHDPLFDEVQIHPCFRKALGTVERIRKKQDEAVAS